MTPQGRPVQASGGARDTLARSPELPRVLLDTRMPTAPAKGGRTIVVGVPKRPSKAGNSISGLVLGALVVAAVGAAAWRYLRPKGMRQRLL